VSAALEEYRAGIIRATQEAGAQAALWDLEWKADAEAALEELAESGAVFTAEDIRARVGPPPSDGALGAILLIASRSGRIRSVGFALAHRTERHGGILRQWVGRGSESW